MQTTPNEPTVLYRPEAADITAKLQRRSFATLATASPAGFPHVAGVLYEMIGDQLYVNTLRSSRKARNVESSGRAAVCVPVRRVPIGGPPSTIQFQAKAEVIALDDPVIAELIAGGKLKSLTGHGEMDMPDGCFLRVTLPDRIHTYGLGMPLRRLIADPLAAGGIVER